MMSEKDFFRTQWTRHESALARDARRKPRKRSQRRGDCRMSEEQKFLTSGKRVRWWAENTEE